jgi:hypothetical protein
LKTGYFAKTIGIKNPQRHEASMASGVSIVA